MITRRKFVGFLVATVAASSAWLKAQKEPDCLHPRKIKFQNGSVADPMHQVKAFCPDCHLMWSDSWGKAVTQKWVKQ